MPPNGSSTGPTPNLQSISGVRGFTVWPDEDFPRTHTLKVKNPIVIETILRGAEQSQLSTPRPGSTSPTGPRGLVHIIAEISRRHTEEITSTSSLGNDLDLDSLGRIELLSAIESELGVYLDESQITPETTVDQLTLSGRRGFQASTHGEVSGLGE